jgi:NADPH-dependent ferric siderophore reductase
MRHSEVSGTRGRVGRRRREGVVHGVLEHSEWLTPAMVRVVLGGHGLAQFEATPYTDQYVNALFVPDGAPYTAPFDVEATRELPSEQRPRGRRLTVRRWDPGARRLTIDIVAHGDVGFAGRWAQRATIGESLQMLGPGGGYRPDPEADWHLFAGDESALPAIAASVEVLEPSAKAIALVVVDDGDHELELSSPAALNVRWLHRSTAPDPGLLLVEAVSDLDWPDGHVDVFVHGEAGEVRLARRHLLADRKVDRSRVSISPYWRRHHTDEAWRAVKKAWLQEQEAEV